MKRTANAVWNGTIKEGKGKLSLESKVLENSPYTFKSRFENAEGTNPDELLAAAHAGCYAMALSNMLSSEGFKPESLDVTAEITMFTEELELTQSHLSLKARIPKIDEAQFMNLAKSAKENCPVSKALSLKITLDAQLLS